MLDFQLLFTVLVTTAWATVIPAAAAAAAAKRKITPAQAYARILLAMLPPERLVASIDSMRLRAELLFNLSACLKVWPANK